jgi:hypothetical protein
MGADTGVVLPQVKGCQSHQKLEEARRILHWCFQREHGPEAP